MAETDRIGQRLGQLTVEEHQIPIIVEQMLVIIGLGDIELYLGIVQSEFGQHIDEDGVGERDRRSYPDKPGDVGLLTLDLAGGLLDLREWRAETFVVSEAIIGKAELAGRAM